MVDISTEKELERKSRNKRIIARWNAIYDPDRGSRNRFLQVLSKEFNMSIVGVKNILIENGLYNKEGE